MGHRNLELGRQTRGGKTLPGKVDYAGQSIGSLILVLALVPTLAFVPPPIFILIDAEVASFLLNGSYSFVLD